MQLNVHFQHLSLQSFDQNVYDRDQLIIVIYKSNLYTKRCMLQTQSNIHLLALHPIDFAKQE